uniref:F-box protein AT5G49610-like beta-propeller domain-containing protein n=1 Tax=Zea mays TaxID=4577 RepID=B4FSH9_MAIZE|nr:unknown [Zea mays]
MCCNAKVSPLPVEMDTSASKVLTNDDLLHDILLRLGCPSCLVSAALTSKCWLRGASDQVFARDFCADHQPRLLGIYVSSGGISGSEFIPFRQPAGGSRPEPSYFPEYPHAMLLPTDKGDDALCYRVDVRIWESHNKAAALVWVLRSGSWHIRCIAAGVLAKSPAQILPTTVLDGGKIYMATQAGYILGLDLATARFFIVDLPRGVELDQYPGNLVHCRGDDSVLYLFHVDGDNRLNVWLRRMEDDQKGHGGPGAAGGSAGATKGWVLRDTISVRETCGHLVEQGWEKAGDGDEDAAAVMIVGAGDNAEFVFLELGVTGVVAYMHVKTREVKQVYQRQPDDDHFISVRPFMLVKPPVFPVLEDAHEGEAAAALHQE